MRLIETRKDTLVVNYFGVILYVNRRFKYLATDIEGSVYSFESEPVASKHLGIWVRKPEEYKARVEFVCKVDLEELPWENSLSTI